MLTKIDNRDYYQVFNPLESIKGDSIINKKNPNRYLTTLYYLDLRTKI